MSQVLLAALLHDGSCSFDRFKSVQKPWAKRVRRFPTLPERLALTCTNFALLRPHVRL